MDPTRELAHEIQASLLAIETRLQSLRGRPGCDETLEACGRELSYLRQVVASVLGVAADAPPALGPVRLGPVMRSVAQRYRPVAGAEGASLQVIVPESDLTVVADPVWTERILTALVDNALKHSASAGVVRLHARRRDSAVEVVVEDDGRGVPRDERERIFEPFEAGASATPGAGLGLAIARALAVSQGAILELCERDGGGAHFSLRWSDA